MEGLQELSASQSNDKWQFNHLQNRSPSGYTAIKITTFSTKEPLYESRSIAWNQAEDVLDVLANHPVPNGGEDAEAYLELLKIPIDDHEVLQIAKQDFLNIIACYNIHPYIRQLLQNNSYGFHQYPAQQGNSSTFYIGTLLYILIWSFDAATMTTAAILLPRESNGFTNGAAAFDEFQTILRIHKSHLYSPYLLAFIAGMHITRWLDNWTYHHLRGIRNAEQATGHGPYGWAGKISLDVDAITRCSRHIGEILVNLANQLRHEDIMDSLIASISDDDSYKNSCRTQILFPKLYDEGMQTFRSVKSALQRQMMSRRSTVTYLQERARSQSTVVCKGFLSHLMLPY
jgi:hypothetical protein